MLINFSIFFRLMLISFILFSSSILYSRSFFFISKLDLSFYLLKKELNNINYNSTIKEYKINSKILIDKFNNFIKNNVGAKYEAQALVQIVNIYYNLANKTQNNNDWIICIDKYLALLKIYKVNPWMKRNLTRLDKLEQKIIYYKEKTCSLKILRKIVIDAGHGGNDNGYISLSGMKEKNITLDIARMVAIKLKNEIPHVKIYMTRNNDMKVTMSERIKFANSVGADLFISIHVNKTKKKHVSGIETYYLDTTNRTYLSNFFNKNNIETKKQKLKYLLANMNIESDTKKSFKLGKLIQESIIINMQNINHKINDLGLTSTMFYVLSGVKMPSILIGFSLFDEKKENITLLNKYKKLFSLGLVCAIKSYIDSEVCSCIP